MSEETIPDILPSCFTRTPNVGDRAFDTRDNQQAWGTVTRAEVIRGIKYLTVRWDHTNAETVSSSGPHSDWVFPTWPAHEAPDGNDAQFWWDMFLAVVTLTSVLLVVIWKAGTR